MRRMSNNSLHPSLLAFCCMLYIENKDRSLKRFYYNLQLNPVGGDHDSNNTRQILQ